MLNKYLAAFLAIVFWSLPNAEAQTTDSNASLSSMAASFPVFTVERPDADFTPNPGSVNFTQRGGLTCTLPSAANAAGKQIVVIQAKWSMRGLKLKSPENEPIISLGRKINRGPLSLHGAMLGDLHFFSDGKNWYLFNTQG
jgi:hypothetical protein